MNNLNRRVKSILLRARKLIWLIILLPIITSAVAYFLASQTPVSYQGSVSLKFGNFENEYLTKPEYMKSYIKTDKFVNEVKEKYNIDLDELRSKLNVDVSPPEKKMTLSISGNDKAAIEEDLSLYTEAVLKASNEKYAMKLNIIESAIAELENTDSEFEKIDKVIEKFDLNYTIPTLEKTEIADNITVSEMPRVSPVQRAIVGFLAGVMLSLFILVLPEVFKD